MKSRSDHPVLRALSPSGLIAGLALVFAFATVLASACGSEEESSSPRGIVASITVTPDVVVRTNHRQRFIAVGRDAFGNVVAIFPSWTVVAGGGAIDSAGVFTAGTIAGTYVNTVRATSDGVSGFASVTVKAYGPPIAR